MHVDEETFEPKHFLYLDDINTNVCYNKESIMDAVGFHGVIVFEDLANMIMVELKEYNITEEEDKEYRSIFKTMIDGMKIK